MAEKKVKDKKVDLYVKFEGEDDYGFDVTRFDKIGAGLWAHVRSLSRKELVASSNNFTEEEIVFTMNWREDLARFDSQDNFYIYFRGIYYQVKRVDPYLYYKDDLTVYCKYVGTKV